MTWISVKDKLPKDGKRVMAYTKYMQHFVGTHEGLFWVITATGKSPYSDVTHWMPLPEPPEE
jgi:hypothetical protein